MRLWIALAALGLALAVVPTASAGPAGTLDPAYGGEVSIPGVRLEPVAITAQSGSAYALARRRTDLDHDAVLAKLTPAGALDPSFGGGDGIVDLPDDFLALDVPPAYEPYGGTRGRPVLLTGDGIVVAGVDASGRAAVVKLTPTGTGVIWGPRVVVSDASAAAAVAQRPDGRLVVAGTTVVGPGVGIFLAELTAGGTVGSVGTRDPSLTTTDLDRIVDLRLQAGGQAVVARETVSTLGDPQALGPAVVERYGTNLTLDGTYGPIGLGAPVTLSRLEPLPGGGLAIVGAAGAAVRSRIVDADGLGDGVVRSASWGINDVRPAAAIALEDGALALFGRRVDDGARTISARLRPDGTTDLRWNPGAGTGLAPVSPGLGEGRVVDAVRDGHTALALVARGEALSVARVTLNDAPTAALTASPANALGPTATITLDASGTLDPDGPTDVRSYAFDADGDGVVDVTSATPTLTRTVTGPLSATASVRATDSLGRVSEAASVAYTVGDGTAPPPPPPPVPPLVSAFPPTINSVLTPSTAVVTALPGPLVALSTFPYLGVQSVLAPVQVGGLEFDQPRPRDGDRVAVTFRVNLRNGGEASVCRVMVVTCPGVLTAIAGREGNVVTVRIVVTASEPQTLTRVRVTNGAGQTLEVPITFAVAPAQTEPDYDIVGVELSQGVQRDTASARPSPPDRDAPYDGVILAGTKGDWGHPESFSSEVPAARIRVWVVAHGIRGSTAPPPELWVTLGRSHATRNGAVVRYGEAPLLSAPTSVPVTPETGLSPAMRADGAIPYVFHWVPDASVPRIAVRLVSPRECGDCSTANNQVTIQRPRVAISRMRPTNVTRIVSAGKVAPDSAALLQATTPGHLRCLFGPGGNSTAERCADLREELSDEAPPDGEPYRPNDRFFTDSTGPMTSLAPFVLGATPSGLVVVPAGADPFTIGYFAQLNTLSSGLPVTRASVALTADGAAGTAVSTPLIGTGAMVPTAIVRDGGRFRLSGLARALHLAWGLAPASGRGGAVGAARWAPDEAGYLGGSAIQVFHGGRGFRPITNSAPTRAGCFGDDLRDLTSACPGLPTISGDNGTWISPRRWEALLVGASERAEIVNGNTVSSGAVLPCPYRALDSTQYRGAAGCAPSASLFDPRPVDMSPFTPNAASASLAATTPAIAITLRVAGTQVTGFAVTPLAAGQPSSGPADARVRFRALDAAGTVIADAGSAPQAVVLGESADGDAVATAVLPATGVARVQAVVDRRVVAQLDRGRAPSVALTATSASIGRSGVVPLRISASDPDGDPLTTTVQASADGGVTWTTLATAGDPAGIRLAAADLPRSRARAGRLRVTVADGFDRVTATTGPLTFAGATPTVRISTPVRKLRRGDDVTATATIGNDTGATVRWRSGSRRVGSGTTLALGRLPAGRHRLTATLGGVRSKAVTVTVRARPPLLLVARRRGCAIRLATDVPVTVRADGRRVGRLAGNAKPRTLRVCGKRVRLTLVGPLGARTVRL
ncbi:hypothetical protein OJ998_22110 [Solirubrobacter taibaiensis]|nr:hypothetical protein [Solirubrobacter taibaiensis]